MERVAKSSLLLGFVLQLFVVLGEGRMLASRFPTEWPEPLPPCGGSYNLPYFDCTPPERDLPPCRPPHTSPGVDCCPGCWPPAAMGTAGELAVTEGEISAHVSDENENAAATGRPSETQSKGVGGPIKEELPPCGGVHNLPGFDCYTPPQHELPPCRPPHTSPGIDCCLGC